MYEPKEEPTKLKDNTIGISLFLSKPLSPLEVSKKLMTDTINPALKQPLKNLANITKYILSNKPKNTCPIEYPIEQISNTILLPYLSPNEPHIGANISMPKLITEKNIENEYSIKPLALTKYGVTG
jgi:hypothetical protein